MIIFLAIDPPIIYFVKYLHKKNFDYFASKGQNFAFIYSLYSISEHFLSLMTKWSSCMVVLSLKKYTPVPLLCMQIYKIMLCLHNKFS